MKLCPSSSPAWNKPPVSARSRLLSSGSIGCPPWCSPCNVRWRKGSSDAAPRSTGEDSRRPKRPPEGLCGTLVTWISCNRVCILCNCVIIVINYSIQWWGKKATHTTARANTYEVWRWLYDGYTVRGVQTRASRAGEATGREGGGEQQAMGGAAADEQSTVQSTSTTLITTAVLSALSATTASARSYRRVPGDKHFFAERITSSIFIV